MPRKEFEAFTRLDASDVNTFLMDQSVMTFGSATARDVAIDTPVEGQVTYLTDIDSLSVYNGTQWVTNRPVMSFAGTAARGSAIATPVEGMTTFREDIDRLETYNGSIYTSPTDLILIRSQTIGSAVASVVVSDVFSATYDAYKVIVSGGVGSTGSNISIKLGSASNGHNSIIIYGTYTNTNVASAPTNNAGSFNLGNIDTNAMFSNFDVVNPFLSQITFVAGSYADPGISGAATGRHSSTTSFTSFTVAPGSGTMTGGTINVYGYRKAL
jgi:hypothetical protein